MDSALTNLNKQCGSCCSTSAKLERFNWLTEELKLHRARENPVEFAEFAFADETGKRMRLPQVHRELHDFLTNAPRGLVEMPRDHGKTTQVLIRSLWELGRNPNLRIMFVCGSNALAQQRGRFLRDAIANNPRVQQVFPHLRPDRPWRANVFRVECTGNSVSPSVVVLGLGAVATGARADLLICDDVVDVRALRSLTIRDKAKQTYRENFVNMLEPDGRAWMLFTPWHAGDLNAELKQNPKYQQFRRAVGNDLEPVWPEKWPKERLQERRQEIGASSFARAFHLHTIAEEDCLIKRRWVRFWSKRGHSSFRDETVDSNLSAGSRNDECPLFDLAPYDFTILAVDPAVSSKHSADASALVTLGRTSDGKVHCLEAIARRVSAPHLMQLIDAADRRWKPDVILFEDNAAFKGIKDLMVAQMRFGSKVKGVRQTREKHARIQAFSVRVENGAFLLKGEGGAFVSQSQDGAFATRGEGGVVDPGQQELLDEMLSFPQGKHDDLLDAAAFGAAYLLDTPEPRILG